MGQELELRSKAKDAAIERAGKLIRRKPQIITKDLKKKEKLTLRDKAWVNNDVILFGAGALTTIASVPGLVLLGIGLGTVGTVASAAALVLGVIITIIGLILMSNRRDEEMTRHLSHAQRRELVLAERTRKNIGHSTERDTRYVEAELQYKQYSVDVKHGGKSIALTLMEHMPWMDGKHKPTQAQLTADQIRVLFHEQHEQWEKAVEEYDKKYKAEMAAAFGPNWLQTHWNEHEYERRKPPRPTMADVATVTITKDHGEPMEKFQARFLLAKQSMDEMARTLEQMAYNEKKEELEVKRLALQVK